LHNVVQCIANAAIVITLKKNILFLWSWVHSPFLEVMVVLGEFGSIGLLASC